MSIKKETYERVSKDAQKEYDEKRIRALSTIWFPSDKYHLEFKTQLQKLLKFQSQRAMRVLESTWKNMCTFNRDFFLPEMSICIEILMRATPNELCLSVEANRWNKEREKVDNEIEPNEEQILLMYYNMVAYPKILEVVIPMKDVLDSIDREVSNKIAAEINSQKKISLQLPISYKVNFVNTNTTG